MTITGEFLIVGGTGFIGSHLAIKVANIGFKVTILSLNKIGKNKRIKDVEYISCDIRCLEDLKRVLKNKRFEYVVNLGGYVDHSKFLEGGGDTLGTHLIGTLNIIQCLDWDILKQYIHIGSSDEYGNQPPPQTESIKERPISSYSMGKTSAGNILQMLYETEKFPAVILRLFLVYGPGQNRQRFLPQIISGCKSNARFPVSKGEQIRDFCYIDDIVNGIIKTTKCDDALGEVINLASGNPIRIKDVLIKVRELVGLGEPTFGAVPYREGENMSLYANISKAKKLIDWEPVISLDEGLKRTIFFYN